VDIEKLRPELVADKARGWWRWDWSLTLLSVVAAGCVAVILAILPGETKWMVLVFFLVGLAQAFFRLGRK
jgi:hypothetical protein